MCVLYRSYGLSQGHLAEGEEEEGEEEEEEVGKEVQKEEQKEVETMSEFMLSVLVLRLS